jgi:hypothetical protein
VSKKQDTAVARLEAAAADRAKALAAYEKAHAKLLGEVAKANAAEVRPFTIITASGLSRGTVYKVINAEG